MESKTVKTGVGVVGGGASLALVFNMMTARLADMNARLDGQDQRIEAVKKELIQYVDITSNAVLIKLGYIEKRQDEANDMLKLISERMYNERKGGK